MKTPVTYIASQKGGVGRSCTALTLGIEFVKNGWSPLIADLDIGHHSSYSSCLRRAELGIEPQVDIAKYPSGKSALKALSTCNMLIVDGALRASKDTPLIASQADLVIIPTGASIDDIEPALDLANSLVSQNLINKENIMFIITRIPGSSKYQANSAINTIDRYGWYCSPNYIRYMPGYMNALDDGAVLTETKHESLNNEAANQIQDIVNRLGELTNGSKK